ncbi:MAG: hypothetical protein JNM07_06860 [Phycisphaerae bacterium]|nr:hypothetical protein [Phycisphaerae bacterium]
MPNSSPGSRRLVLALLVASVASVGGCIGPLIGGMAESYMQSSTKTVEAEYTGLKGKRFAVLVAADRIIQADYPEIIPKLTVDITERIRKEAGGIVARDAAAVLEYQYNRPRWVTMRPSELLDEFTADRLIVIELEEYRLNDPGNPYLWQGAASGTVSVIERGSFDPDAREFEKRLTVGFPDSVGAGPGELARIEVNSALAKRFVDRATWVFYAHEEPYYPKY